MTAGQNSLIPEEAHYCAVHPDRETELRCIRCDRYMCMTCTVQSPVGYICRECARKADDKFFNGTSFDTLIYAGVPLAGGVLASLLFAFVPFLRFWILAMLLGIGTAGIVSEVARRLTDKRKGRRFPEAATAGALIGCAALALVFGMLDNFGYLIFAGVYIVTLYSRLRLRR